MATGQPCDAPNARTSSGDVIGLVVPGTPATRGVPGSAMLPAGQAADAFGLVFAAAILCLAIGFAATLALDERPLRGA